VGDMGSGLTFRVFKVGNLMGGWIWAFGSGGDDRLDWRDPFDTVGLGWSPWRDWLGFENMPIVGTKGMDCVFILRCLSRKGGD
jgi:hypothetical protein